MKITPLLLTLALGIAPATAVYAQDQPANNTAPPPSAMETAPMDQTAPDGMHLTPQLRARLLSQVQDLMVMSQNTAAWTSQGLVVLQGNRLLVYAPDLSLKRSINLPVPPTTPALTSTTVPQLTSMANLIPPRIIPTDRGLFIVRWRQIIRLDKDFQVTSQAVLPSGSPLTAENLGAVCPLCLRMAMVLGLDLAMGTGMEMPTPGSAGNVAPANSAGNAGITAPDNGGGNPGSAGTTQPAPPTAAEQDNDNDNCDTPAPPAQPVAPTPPTPPSAD